MDCAANQGYMGEGKHMQISILFRDWGLGVGLARTPSTSLMINSPYHGVGRFIMRRGEHRKQEFTNKVLCCSFSMTVVY